MEHDGSTGPCRFFGGPTLDCAEDSGVSERVDGVRKDGMNIWKVDAWRGRMEGKV